VGKWKSSAMSLFVDSHLILWPVAPRSPFKVALTVAMAASALGGYMCVDERSGFE